MSNPLLICSKCAKPSLAKAKILSPNLTLITKLNLQILILTKILPLNIASYNNPNKRSNTQSGGIGAWTSRHHDQITIASVVDR